MTWADYFFHKSPKDWHLSEAFILYDKKNSFDSFNQLLNAVEQDLLRVQAKQDTTRQFTEAKIQWIHEMKHMTCLRQENRSVTNNVAVEKLAETLNNNGEINIENNFNRSAKRKERECENDNPYIQNSPTRRHFTSREAPEDTTPAVPFEEYKRAVELPNQLVLTHGKKQYTINTPSRSKGSPHRPKLTKSHVEALQNYVHFATSAVITANNATKVIYESHRKNERNYKSLKDLGLHDEVKDILDNIPFDNFPASLWQRELQINEDATRFTRIVKYMLTSFHLLCSNNRLPSTNHERTFFVEYCVPGLLALAKTTDMLSFHWCEFELQAMKDVFIFENDFNMLKTPKRFLDALGKMHSLTNMEAVIVEASSGGLTEDVTHSVEDTIKTIECATASLQSVAMKYKCASIETFKKLQIFSIHIIKDRMTLTSTMLNDAFTWNRIDIRSATIPTTWEDRICLVQYFELLATLMDGLKECSNIENILKRENIGVDAFKGQSIVDYLDIK